MKRVRRDAVGNIRPMVHPRTVASGERGIALVIVLVISAMALAMMSALIYMITAGTQTSGLNKRYSAAVDAGKAGADFSLDVITHRGNINSADPEYQAINFGFPTSACMQAKMTTDTASWSTGGVCNATYSDTDYIDPNNAASYDWSFQLANAGVGQPYTVYAKIVDTVAGNTGGGTGLLKNGVVSSTGEVPVVPRPYLYTVEVDAEQGGTQAEKARYSMLYQY